MANSGTVIIRNSTPDVAGEEVLQNYIDGGVEVRTIPQGSTFKAFVLKTAASGEMTATPAVPEFVAGLAALEVYMFSLDLNEADGTTSTYATPGGVIVGWSFSDNDEGAIKAQTELFRDRLTTVAAGFYTNCIYVSNHAALDPAKPIITVSPGNTIQTLGIVSADDASTAITCAFGISE